MGKAWDEDKGGRTQWIAWMSEVMKECLRVMKPGAHGLIWALPRTSHWTATALEDAGFEVRDVVTHLFGSGFPKSMNISIAIDKQSGAMEHRGKAFVTAGAGERKDIQNTSGWEKDEGHAGITPEAKQWQGWGTALKPSVERWLMVRKPLATVPLDHMLRDICRKSEDIILVRKPISEKTVAANVLKWGCGGINIEASRIGTDERFNTPAGSLGNGINMSGGKASPERVGTHVTGRFPANLVLSHNEDCVEECTEGCAVADLGGASRFFYCSKPSKREKNEGCEVNGHPTVKSTKLMSYLITMITPPGGKVLDPFLGSGSTGVAAVQSGFQFTGIEKEPEYLEIAKKRIYHHMPQFKKETSNEGS